MRRERERGGQRGGGEGRKGMKEEGDKMVRVGGNDRRGDRGRENVCKGGK